MYRTIADFTHDWDFERGTTRKVMDHLTGASLAQAVTPTGRTIARLGWHLVLTIVEMPGEAGIKIDGPRHGDPAPTSATALAEAYSAAAERLREAVIAQWSDSALAEDVPMYGETWKKGGVLRSLINHEAHHRGQMMVLMRQAGLRVPGVYGPAEEDWASMGMPAQE
ncbi:MAG: DinB family protein [Acidobacteria bacterium]|nr:DinB family protein [Acidobacteriota bacterium]